MKINTKDIQDGIKLITLAGQIDENSINLVQDTFSSVFNLNCNTIVCDMKTVEHVSAPVLNTFIRNIHTAREKNGDMKLLNVHPSLQAIFRYAGFNEDNVFVSDIDSAVQALKQTGNNVQGYGNDNIDDPFAGTINSNFASVVSAPPRTSPLQNNNIDQEDPYSATIQSPISPLQNRNTKQVEDPYSATIQSNVSPLQNRNTKQVEDPYSATIQSNVSPLQSRKSSPNLSPSIDAHGATISFDKSPLQSRPVKQPSADDVTNDSFSVASAEQDLSFLSGGNPEPTPAPQPVKIEPAIETAQDAKVFKYEITYHIADKIAEGHMGKLYRGEEVSACGFKKPVALKYLKTHYSKQNCLEILKNEICKASLITHQNIAQMHKLVTLNNYYFVVMEYVDGVDLATMLQKLKANNRQLPPHLASLIIYNICSALAYANRKLDNNQNFVEIVHGEITAENVIISKDLDVKLVGLGVSKASNIMRHQENASFAEAFTHMSIDVKQSGVPSKSGDIFSLGVLFYELLTNQKPYTAQEINSQSNEIVFPSRINSKATDILDGLVLRCLGANPASRWKDFEDLGLQLEESLQTKGFSLTQASLKKFLEINSIF